MKNRGSEIIVSKAGVANISVYPDLKQRIIEAQATDEWIQKQVERSRDDPKSKFGFDDMGIFRYKTRICVPEELKRLVLEEAHKTAYSIHPGGNKMYRDLKLHYWWHGMKRDVADFVKRCLTCQRVKAEHQKPGGTLQPLPIPTWKWEQVTMDFVSGLPKVKGGFDGIWVVIDRLTKSAHFLKVRMSDKIEKLADLYCKEIVRLHGIPVSIVSDRDPRFTAKFWQDLQKCLGSRLNFSTASHPQTDGQSERLIKYLEDMLRACVLDFHDSWDRHLALIEFAYNNSYQASIGMAPYEALYGRKCRSPLFWDLEDWHWTTDGVKRARPPKVIEEAIEKVQIIRQRMKMAQDRQKSYADRRRRPLEFEVGDRVFLKASPRKGFTRIGRGGKLNPRYLGPFEILERIGETAYRLDLPPNLTGIHNVFHVSQLRKFYPDESLILPVEDVQLEPDLTIIKKPVQILDKKFQVLRNRQIPLVKVLWRDQKSEEATWETEEKMRRLYPELFEAEQ